MDNQENKIILEGTHPEAQAVCEVFCLDENTGHLLSSWFQKPCPESHDAHKFPENP